MLIYNCIHNSKGKAEGNMKKILRNISLLALTLVLFTTSFSGFASAKVKTDQESKKVEELAKHLEFIFEEAALKDDNGNVIGFDANKIEEKFGPIPEIEKLKTISNPDEVTIKPMNAAVDRCVEKKIKSEYGDIITGAAIGAIVDYISERNYKMAAKKAIALGLRGSVVGIAIDLSILLGKCIASET